MRPPFTRLQAAGISLVVALTVALIIFLVNDLVWYPGPLFDSAGGFQLFLVAAFVNVTLGPLLTFIVFVPGKKGLWFDLTVIPLMQVVALAYGLAVMFQARPVYIVFAKDRFELVRAAEIPAEALRKASGTPYASLPLLGPRVVGARLPTNPDEAFRVMLSGMAGVDVQAYPEYYVPYESIREEARSHSLPLGELRRFNPQERARIDALPRGLGRPEGELRFLPLRAGRRDLAVIMDAHGDVLETVELRPWQY